MDEEEETRLVFRTFSMRRSLWILLALLAVLIALIFFLKKREVPLVEEDLPPVQKFLFAEKESPIIGLEIETEYFSLSLARGVNGLWVAVKPEGAAVSQGMVEAALSQLRALPLLAENLSLSPTDVGIGSQASITRVRFAEESESAFRVGYPTPSGRGYYIQYEEAKIGIVAKDSLDAFFRLLDFFE